MPRKIETWYEKPDLPTTTWYRYKNDYAGCRIVPLEVVQETKECLVVLYEGEEWGAPARHYWRTRRVLKRRTDHEGPAFKTRGEARAYAVKVARMARDAAEQKLEQARRHVEEAQRL